MMKAIEAREIMNKEIEKRANERKQLAKNYCEEVIENEIAERAKEGSSTLVHFVSRLISTDCVRACLEENGYEVEKEADKITIKW